MYGFSGIPEHKAAFEERLELLCLTSDKDRRDGTAPGRNRTYIGERRLAERRQQEQLRRWGMSVKSLCVWREGGPALLSC